MLSHLIRELILPPSSLLLLLVASWLLHKKKPKWGTGLFVFTCLTFYLLSIPLVSLWLTRTTEKVPPLGVEEVRAFGPQAIVVLGAGVDYHAREYGGETVPSAAGMKRAEYAAYLARQLELPVITTGGYGETAHDSEGHTMARYLRRHGLETVLVEPKSQNTLENAHFAKKLADAEGYQRVILVTDASHAARAEAAFRHAGFEAKAAPTWFRSRGPWVRGVLLVIPHHYEFHESCSALRAHLGEVYYALRRRL